MATTITASGNNIAVDGLILPKIWITTLEQNPFPANGRIPASLVCWRGGNNLKIPIPDLIDTMVGGEAFVSTFRSYFLIAVLDPELHDLNRPRILLAKPSPEQIAAGSAIELKDGNRFRFRRENRRGPNSFTQVFIVQEINDTDVIYTDRFGNDFEVIEIVVDIPVTSEDFGIIHGGLTGAIPPGQIQIQSIESDILTHRNKIHALTY